MSKKSFLFISILAIMLILSGCPDKDKTEENDDENEKIPNVLEKANNELEQIVTLLGGPIFDSREEIDRMKNQQMEMLSDTISKQADQASLGNDEKKGVQDNNQAETKEEGKDPEEKKAPESSDEESEDEKDPVEKDRKEEGSGEEGQKGPAEDEPEKESGSAEESEQEFQLEDSLFGIPQWNEDNWKLIKVLADGLHFTWNSLQPELIQKGVSNNQISGFGTALEGLSECVGDMNIKDAQVSVFQMTEALAAFSSYYKTKTPPELQRIKSMVIGIHFFVRQGNWEQAQELANRLQQELETLKSGMQDNSSTDFQMLAFSLVDLDRAVQNQNDGLILLRTNLVTSNLKELESKLSQGQ